MIDEIVYAIIAVINVNLVPHQQSCSKYLCSEFVSKVIAECDDNMSESSQT
jgi:hypothetical protein